MRQIKFRGKNSIGDWWYGNLITREYLKDGQTKHIYEISDITTSNFCTGIIPETIGQFTGLTDKNGKEIYEGDVVLFTWFSYGEYELETEYQGSIDFLNGSFLFCCEHGNYPLSELEFDSESDIEVIGNIHDNPELLTK